MKKGKKMSAYKEEMIKLNKLKIELAMKHMEEAHQLSIDQNKELHKTKLDYEKPLFEFKKIGECQRLWRNARERYTKEQRKMRNTASESAATEEDEWPLYGAMSFLLQYIKPRKTSGNVQRTETFNSTERASPALSVYTESIMSSASPMYTESVMSLSDVEVIYAQHEPQPATSTTEVLPSTETPRTNSKKRRRGASSDEGEDLIGTAMGAVATYFANVSKDDSDECFGKYIASELKKFSKRIKNNVKRDIMEILCNCADGLDYVYFALSVILGIFLNNLKTFIDV
ncbi:hypothetical protein RN001_005977 [Aquatica leii]|uniref:MADF domain-containing protein n=1 Tax=Aquatica leii TaxID=1421715 RepID=A0AAN7SQ15_9COLE|nr:hypothetical protein RN001_005977 [Aquatica leii]